MRLLGPSPYPGKSRPWSAPSQGGAKHRERHFRTELRRRRLEANLSLQQLAELVPCDHGYLSKIENGHRRPGPDMTASLEQALSANGALFALAGEEQEGGEDMRRRRVLQALSAAGMAVAGWPLPSAETPRRIGMQHVADIADTTAVYRGWVSRHGGAAVQQPAAQLLDRAAAMHTAASEPKVRTALLVAIADLGAYVARDIGDHRSADEHAWLALSAATAAGNTALGGHTVVRMAGHNIELRHPEKTLSLLDAAAKRAGDLFTPGDRANQSCIRAWAYAQVGDADMVRRAVGNAEDAFTRVDNTGTPNWAAQHVTEAELYSLSGAAYTDLARTNHWYADAAIERLNEALDLRGVSLARSRVLDQLSLAEALLYAGEFDEAGRIALAEAEVAGTSDPGGLSLRFAGLTRRMQAHASKAASVTEFVTAQGSVKRM
ncbi:helix-turn-helix domain-containing protein [Micromonospora humida]|uniref:Helix-turn-helix transcriptional regulator n=1 Tax=Micromonospora humida TaxID=2809018 RepID=A0ABS2IND7_9ACTN|nr:helix-turn-helix transcriptional regulator [Micromonospora humida]MBM7075521.1 helix-turn-helix transcriptional regulator [Micromonospora humida]